MNSIRNLPKRLYVVLVSLFAALSVSAYDFEVDGIYYDFVSLSEFTCKVVKEASNKYYEGDIVIPATVDYIDRTFTVVEIEDKVFRNCSKLTGISIPNTISSIGDEMFLGCSKLVRVIIEDGETTLELGYNYYYGGKGLFYACPIKTLYLGRNLSYGTSSYRGYSPFANNNNIREVTIGNSVTEIGDNAFYGCYYLTSVTMGNSVTRIGFSAFDDCRGLRKVIVKDIAAWCGISFSYNPLYFAHHLYSDEETEIKDLVIPNSVTEIGRRAFDGCSGLESVTIPNSVTSIGKYAFSGCSGLKSVTIGNSVTEVGESAFYDCSGLESVTIGNSVTKIDNSAFYNCMALTTIYSLNTTPPSVDSFNYKQYYTVHVFVPEEALTAYKNANVWKDFLYLQGFDATGIESVKGDAMNGNNVYYDLNGNRLDAPKKGLNIINGKKVIVK